MPEIDLLLTTAAYPELSAMFSGKAFNLIILSIAW